MKNILFDSDVILDFYLDRMPYCDTTAILLSMCETKQIKGFITPLAMSNIFYLLRKVGKKEDVIIRLNQLISIMDIIDMNKKIVLTSLHSDFTDFEDALQNYAAEYSNKISIIITRNKKDYKHSKLTVLTPTEFLNTF